MSEQEFKIRLGVPDDIHNIMPIAHMAVEENAFIRPNIKKLLYGIYSALCRDHGLVGVIEGANGEIEGGVLLHVTESWYSDTPMLEEKVIFIHPDYRSAKGGRARKLCEFSKHVADKLGMPLLIGVQSNSRTEGKIRLYKRQFGPPAGAFFLHGAQTGGWKIEENAGNTENIGIETAE